MDAKQLAIVITNTRDFCGNEYQAARDACDDAGIELTDKLWRRARAIANGLWAQSRIAAGVPEKYRVI